MSRIIRNIKIIVLTWILVQGACTPQFEKYERPDWLEGKMFDQIDYINGADSFAVCLERTGYDTILNAGNYTVFAPDNDAFEVYFNENPELNSIAEIPYSDLLAMVKAHIIQNPWSRDQLQRANEFGWIDPKDPNNNEPWGYKRQTLLKEPNRKYWILRKYGSEKIVDSTESNSYRIVFQKSRKYIPIFFDNYLRLAGLESRDFEFYFDRPFEPGFMYVAGAQLHPEDYFAENGFIFLIDKVVTPLKNTEQLLEDTLREFRYDMFLDLIYQFPRFHFNQDATYAQSGVDEGMEYESLWELDYDTMAFDIHEEVTGRYSFDDQSTTRYHNGLIAPTNQALQDLINNVITIQSGDSTRWPSFDAVPGYIKKIIVNAHMSEYPIYLTNLENGFLNGEWDSVYVDPATVVDKYYCSNATFFGVDEAVIPRAFSSVTAPVYLRPQYEGFMNGIELSGLAPFLKRRTGNYSFFIVQVGNTYFNGWSAGNIQDVLLNQVGQWTPRRIARKEFIPSYGGNYILFDSARNNRLVREPTDNGETYAVNGLFWTRNRDLYWYLHNNYHRFWRLMYDAGMVNYSREEFTFLNEKDFHTIFVPSDAAMSRYNTDTLSNEEIQNFVKYHFVWEELIFTDANKPPGEYRTLRIDEVSGTFKRKHSTLRLLPQPDRIRIYNHKTGTQTCDIRESSNRTNVMTTIWDSGRRITTGVVHRIDTVLIKP